jgi:hypothetical protein
LNLKKRKLLSDAGRFKVFWSTVFSLQYLNSIFIGQKM